MTPSFHLPRPRPALSAEVFTIPLEAGQYLIYAPVRRSAFVGTAAAVNLLAEIGEGSVAVTDDNEPSIDFLRFLQIVDGGPEVPPIETFTGIPRPTTITLFLTTICNLRCTYCYASAGERPVKSMKIETAKRGIDFVVNNALERRIREFQVGYHGGGEPTVLWSVLTESHDYARLRATEAGLTLRSSSATNGVLTDKQIDWVVGNLDSVTVSFDGLPEVQDKHRFTVLGQGSSERVTHTLKRFDECGYGYGIRMTVTADNISRLHESVAYICDNFRPNGIQVEPSYQLGRWRGKPTAETEDFISAYRSSQTYAKSKGHTLLYSAARTGTLTNHFCGISRDSFSLSPDGNVSACFEVFAEDLPWADHFFYGKPSGDNPGYDFDLRILNQLRAQSVDNREYCSGCFAKWTCAGDCYHKALDTTKSDEFVGTERCHITRELTKDQVLEKIAASGGLFWHEETNAAERREEAISEEARVG